MLSDQYYTHTFFDPSTRSDLRFRRNEVSAVSIRFPFVTIFPNRIQIHTPPQIIASSINVVATQVAATTIHVGVWTLAVGNKILEFSICVGAVADHIGSTVDFVVIDQQNFCHSTLNA